MEVDKAKKPKVDTQDILFVSGSVLVVVGAGYHSLATAFITAGVFLLFAPVLNIVQSFFRGLKN
jgi:hypothetical protein